MQIELNDDDTNKIFDDTAVREESCGSLKKAVVSVGLVICLVFRDGVDVVIVSRIN